MPYYVTVCPSPSHDPVIIGNGRYDTYVAAAAMRDDMRRTFPNGVYHVRFSALEHPVGGVCDGVLVLWPHPLGADSAPAAPARPDHPLDAPINGTFIALPVDWPRRERRRFATGDYTPVPWQFESWADSHPLLFAHMSLKSPGMVSFTETPAKGEADVQAKGMAPGRFLNKYYADHLTAQDMERWATECAKLAGLLALQVTSDADEIERVYVEGPRSCMSHSASCFAGHCHPARVYAGPDLAVAFLGDLDSGEITARCVVWPDKMHHGRVYAGDVRRMEMALRDAGFTEGSLEGARVQYLERNGTIVMPYVDGIDSAEIDGDYVVLGSGDLCTQQTNGTTGERYSCDCCGDHADEDDLQWIESQDETWCGYCISQRLSRCDYDDCYYRDGDMVDVLGFSRYNTVYRENIESIDAVYVESRGEYWKADEVSYCEDCSEHFHVDDMVMVDDGDDCSTCAACAEKRQADLDERLKAEAEAEAEAEAAMSRAPDFTLRVVATFTVAPPYAPLVIYA